MCHRAYSYRPTQAQEQLYHMFEIKLNQIYFAISAVHYYLGGNIANVRNNCEQEVGRVLDCPSLQLTFRRSKY